MDDGHTRNLSSSLRISISKEEVFYPYYYHRCSVVTTLIIQSIIIVHEFSNGFSHGLYHIKRYFQSITTENKVTNKEGDNWTLSLWKNELKKESNIFIC